MDDNKDLGLEPVETPEAEAAALVPAEPEPAELSETDDPAELSETDDPAELSETDNASEEEDDGPPPDLVFGLQRRTFYFLVVGYALGMIVVALLGIAGLYPEDGSTLIPGVAGAAIGYLISTYLDKRDAAKNAENAEEPKN